MAQAVCLLSLGLWRIATWLHWAQHDTGVGRLLAAEDLAFSTISKVVGVGDLPRTTLPPPIVKMPSVPHPGGPRGARSSFRYVLSGLVLWKH